MEGRTVLILLPLFFVGLYILLLAAALDGVFPDILLGKDTFILGIGNGTSMYPTIKNGDYMIIDLTPEDIKVGDIIVYVHYIPNKGLIKIGHRVIAITDNGYIVMGDNNEEPDPWIVKEDQIIGEVEVVIDDPILKKVVEFWFEREVIYNEV